MRLHFVAALVAASALSWAGALRAQEKPEAPRLPLAPFADARPGDWSTLAMEMRTGTERKGDPFLRGSQRWEVKAIESGTVTIAKEERFSTRVLEPRDQTLTFAATETPTIAAF